jgi:glyoxalase family protein
MRLHAAPRLDHIAACAGQAAANLSFYVGFLGLDVLDAPAGWLLYGAPPGSGRPCLAFRLDAQAPNGRHGAGQAEEVCLAIPEGSAGHWCERAAAAGRIFCPTERFGQPGLRIRDPDGMLILLAERRGAIARSPDILGLCGTTLWVRDQRREAALLADVFGCGEEGVDGGIRRLRLGDAHLDLQDAEEFPDGRPGRGVVEHLSLTGCDAIRAAADRLLAPCPGGWLLPGGVRLHLSP